MSVPTLPLAFIGWFFAILSFVALAIGATLLRRLFRGGSIPPGYLRSRILNDVALLLVWLIGLGSACGLLLGRSWGRAGMEFFCWVLIALILLSGATRLLAHARLAPDERPQARAWVAAVAGVMLVAFPLVTLCGMSIYTLRGEQARAQFEQQR